MSYLELKNSEGQLYLEYSLQWKVPRLKNTGININPMQDAADLIKSDWYGDRRRAQGEVISVPSASGTCPTSLQRNPSSGREMQLHSVPAKNHSGGQGRGVARQLPSKVTCAAFVMANPRDKCPSYRPAAGTGGSWKFEKGR